MTAPTEALNLSAAVLRDAVDNAIGTLQAPLRAAQSRLRNLRIEDRNPEIAEIVKRAAELAETDDPLELLLVASERLVAQDREDVCRQLGLSAADSLQNKVEQVAKQPMAIVGRVESGVAAVGEVCRKTAILAAEPHKTGGLELRLANALSGQVAATRGDLNALVALLPAVKSEAEQVIVDLDSVVIAASNLGRTL